MTSEPPVFEDVEDAARRLEGHAVVTPLLRCDVLDEAGGGRVFVKAECLQRTGSFKFRGAWNRLSRLDAEQKKRGVVAFSSGNHAQGVAAVAKLLGMPAVIVMPADAPAVKAEGVRALGARIVPFDRETEDRNAIAARLAAETGAVVVPAFDDPFVIAGQGTTGLEIVAQAAGVSLDAVLCPAGGGGLVAGVGLAMKRLSPETRIWAVEPAGFDDHRRSLAAGRIVCNERLTGSICDALLAPAPGEITFALNRMQLSGAVTVSDDEALAAMAFAFRHLKIVLEPGGAVALAAVLNRRVETQGRAVCVVVSGGNVDPALFARALT